MQTDIQNANRKHNFNLEDFIRWFNEKASQGQLDEKDYPDLFAKCTRKRIQLSLPIQVFLPLSQGPYRQ